MHSLFRYGSTETQISRTSSHLVRVMTVVMSDRCDSVYRYTYRKVVVRRVRVGELSQG